MLTSQIGRTVRRAGGALAGKVIDLTVRLVTPHPRLARLAVGSHRQISHLVPWSALDSFAGPEIVLHAAPEMAEFAIHGREPGL